MAKVDFRKTKGFDSLLSVALIYLELRDGKTVLRCSSLAKSLLAISSLLQRLVRLGLVEMRLDYWGYKKRRGPFDRTYRMA